MKWVKFGSRHSGGQEAECGPGRALIGKGSAGMGCEAGNRESPRGCASAPRPSPAGCTSTGLVCLRDQKRRWVMSRYTLTSLTYFCPCWVFVRLCRFSFYLQRVRATLDCCAQASHGSDFSRRGARALGPASFGDYGTSSRVRKLC